MHPSSWQKRCQSWPIFSPSLKTTNISPLLTPLPNTAQISPRSNISSTNSYCNSNNSININYSNKINIRSSTLNSTTKASNNNTI